MLGSILGKKSKKNEKVENEFIHKLATMDATEMRLYVNDRLDKFELDSVGLAEIMKKILNKNSEDKEYLDLESFESKVKKVFDLVILISKNKHLSVPVVEMIQEFITKYDDVIKKYDHDNKQTYESKLNDALSNAVKRIDEINELTSKMDYLKE